MECQVLSLIFLLRIGIALLSAIDSVLSRFNMRFRNKNLVPIFSKLGQTLAIAIFPGLQRFDEGFEVKI
jgi:hypothetical protein